MLGKDKSAAFSFSGLRLRPSTDISIAILADTLIFVGPAPVGLESSNFLFLGLGFIPWTTVRTASVPHLVLATSSGPSSVPWRSLNFRGTPALTKLATKGRIAYANLVKRKLTETSSVSSTGTLWDLLPMLLVCLRKWVTHRPALITKTDFLSSTILWTSARSATAFDMLFMAICGLKMSLIPSTW